MTKSDEAVGRAHVLVVEDDEQIKSFVGDYLEANGHRVTSTDTIEAAEASLEPGDIDLVVLDRMVQGRSGLELMDTLRGRNIPVIILTALSRERERIEGLEAGADDYVGKPFSPKELLARIQAVLRRHKSGSAPDRPVRSYRFDGWKLDMVSRKLFDPTGTRVYLRTAEVMLLQILCEHAGEVLNRETIIKLTHIQASPRSERSVDLIVSRLRRRIERDPRDPSMLLTQRTAGYFFTPKVVAE